MSSNAPVGAYGATSIGDPRDPTANGQRPPVTEPGQLSPWEQERLEVVAALEADVTPGWSQPTPVAPGQPSD